jgi:hypothetical protein
MRMCNFIYVHKKSNDFLWTFPVPKIFQLEREEYREKFNLRHYVKYGSYNTDFHKTHTAQRNYAETFYTEFHQNLSRNVEVTGRN